MRLNQKKLKKGAGKFNLQTGTVLARPKTIPNQFQIIANGTIELITR